MDFSSSEDIAAPIDFVFRQITDFAGFERSIMRRGADVERLKGGDAPVVGAKWRVTFRLRGTERTVKAELTEVDDPNMIRLAIDSKNIEGGLVVELVPLSRARTRLNIKLDLKPKTLSARLVFQSMRLTRQRSLGRFKALVAGFAEDAEARYRA